MAFTIIPLFGNALLKVTQREEAHKTIFDYFKGYYNRFLDWAFEKTSIDYYRNHCAVFHIPLWIYIHSKHFYAAE